MTQQMVRCLDYRNPQNAKFSVDLDQPQRGEELDDHSRLIANINDDQLLRFSISRQQWFVNQL